eukprot:COSAG02_NODE_2614_length_8415_cov_84.832011_1_plen_252_part_10
MLARRHPGASGHFVRAGAVWLGAPCVHACRRKGRQRGVFSLVTRRIILSAEPERGAVITGMLHLALVVTGLLALATHSSAGVAPPSPPPSSTVSLMTSDKLGNFEPDGWEGYACTFAEWTACINSTTVSCNDSKSTCLKCTSKRGTAPSPIACTRAGTQTQYHFPAGGVFPVVEQFHMPPNTAIVGAANPNDPADMTRQNTDVAGHTWFVVPARNTLCGDDPMCKDSTARGSTACSGDPRTHRQGFLMASNS